MAFKQILISYNVSMAKSTLSPILTCRRVKRFLKNTSLSPDYVMMLVLYFQVCTNCAPDVDSGPQKLWDEPYFLGAYILPYKNEKKNKLRSTSFQLIRYNNERVKVNFKYQSTCNILIKFKYLGISELFYLLKDWETIN